MPDLAGMLYADEDLDLISNAVVSEIKAGRLNEAERLCQQLAERYPDFIDLLERYAMLCEARGDHAIAAVYYRRAADYARTHEGFDPELVALWLADAERMEAMVQEHPRRLATQPATLARDDGESPPESDESD
jgi:tetratricopeptide (TPR) repeat protein